MPYIRKTPCILEIEWKHKFIKIIWIYIHTKKKSTQALSEPTNTHTHTFMDVYTYYRADRRTRAANLLYTLMYVYEPIYLNTDRLTC